MQILTEQEQITCVQPVILTQPASTTASDHNTEDEEEDWQQLSALPQASAPSTASRDSQQAPPLLYIDHSAVETEPMGFRELFLRSNALENLFAGIYPHLQSRKADEPLQALENCIAVFQNLEWKG